MSEWYPQQNSPGASCGADKQVCTTLEELLQRNPQTRMSDLPTGTRVLVNAQYWVTVGKDSPQGESGVWTQRNIKKMEKNPPDGIFSYVAVSKFNLFQSEGSRVTDDEWEMA
ncbi:hypothetical protein CIHG_09907 [Coccidioides immitis H538.4]|uniref:Uncharacterized protein n=1 Tax=Coccidioides immitis H538.4 TaxID=396776 RepID=A0A0J8S6T5_COCIT|nr:hypothetical protein CIHG_09907 [Coccidioides immitis H538.4]